MYLPKLIPVILLALLLVHPKVNSQVNIQNFTRNQYLAGAQNWNFQQDKKGNLYVANNEGLLIYNGKKWTLYPMPNKTIVRFICFGPQNRLYAGGQDEIGYFEPDRSGRLVYHSLLNLINPQDRQFADVWNIVQFGEDMFFRTSSRIFRLHNNKVTSFLSNSKWDFLGVHQNQLIAHDLQKGILVFQEDLWTDFIPPALLPKNFAITAISTYDRGSVFTTPQNGLLRLIDNQLSSFQLKGTGITNDQYFTSICSQNKGGLLLGTYDNGLYLVDSSGMLLAAYSKTEGLNNNNVKCIFEDSANNIWLGLEDGISCFNLNSSIKWFNPKSFNGAAGYAATIHQGNLFFAMANGIYSMPFKPDAFTEMVNNPITKIANGLSWNLTEANGSVFTGRDDGSYEIKDSKLVPIDKSTGYWIFRPMWAGDKQGIAAGNYQGINFFGEEGGTYRKSKDLSYLNTSSRFLEYDSIRQSIWISHPYRGVYKISLGDYGVKQFTDKDGLPSSLNNHVFRIDGKILIATTNGIYEYDDQSSGFKLSPAYDSLFHQKSLRYLKEDLNGNLWFVQEKSLGVFVKKEKSLIYFPELNRRILSGFEHLFPLNKESVLVGAEQGFFVVNLNKYLSSKRTPAVFIRNVVTKSVKDSVLYDGF